MTVSPPPVGPDLQQWARATRSYLQRWLPRLQWKRQDDNPSENGVTLWDEAIQFPVVSKNDEFLRYALISDIAEIVVVVKEASQLSGTLDSSKVYLIDGVIDMGSTQITVPEGGLVIRGFDFGVSGLTSSENSYTMFVSPGGGYSGTLLMRDMFVTTSGTGSQVFDLDNQGNGGAVECTDFNFVNCTSLGTLDAYRQGLFSNWAAIACSDGLTMEGTWSGGFAILTAIIVSAGTPFTGTLLKKGASLSVEGSIRSDINALQLDATGAICDFEPANIVNDAGFRMSEVRSNPAATPFPNMPSTSVKARFSNSVGFRNTYVGAQWSITAETATVITATNTPVKVAGTTTYTDENWFDHTTDNAMRYIGSDQVGVIIHGQLSFSGTNGNQINVIVRHWVDATSSYVDLSETGPFTMNAGGRAENIGILGFCDFDQNDRLEIWVENQSATNNVTAKLGGIVSISERSS